ncbi:MAG TPA: 3-dehydroquinate synthase, partial [Myxococcota bacterium]
LADRVRFIDATEQDKSFAALEPHYLWLVARGLRRNDTIVAIGGGVVQDITCFIASTLMRGVRWTLIPTTLLAQCDSCIGSKSSINIGAYKNQLGTFYPPHEVLLCSDVLATLPADEIRSGLGEAVKLHLLESDAAVVAVEATLASLARQSFPDTDVLGDIVRRSLALKKPYIEEDEFDRGRRHVLNYGHTFGHAYEAVTDYAIPHGIAVTLGMLTATFVSFRLGLVDEGHAQRVAALLRPLYEPYEQLLRQEHIDAVVEAMRHDKKNDGNDITCILTRGCGAMSRERIAAETLRGVLGERFAAATG